MIESNCPDCGVPGKRMRWKPLPGKRMQGLIEHIFSCNNRFCPRSRSSWSVIRPLEES